MKIDPNPMRHPHFHDGLRAMARADETDADDVLVRYEFYVHEDTGELHICHYMGPEYVWNPVTDKWDDVNEEEDEDTV